MDLVNHLALLLYLQGLKAHQAEIFVTINALIHNISIGIVLAKIRVIRH